MELVTLACNECGAPLTVDAVARYLSCSYRGAQLEVHRRDGGTWTKRVETLEKRLEKAQRRWRRRNRDRGRRSTPQHGSRWRSSA